MTAPTRTATVKRPRMYIVGAWRDAASGAWQRIVCEENFGPVLSVIRFEDEAIANDTPNGLAAGIWTRDLARAHRMIRRFQSETVWANAYPVLNIDVPFGGVKQSGYGRQNGFEAMRHYLQIKAARVELNAATRDPSRLG